VTEASLKAGAPRWDRESPSYTIFFATVVCVVCALLVAVAAVSLQPTQEAKARMYAQKNVLLAAGLISPDPDAQPREAELRRLFDERIDTRLVDLSRGELLPRDKLDPKTYDQRKARNDPAQSRPAPENRAGIARLPNYAVLYLVRGAGGKDEVEQMVLAVEGLGMWGTIYGFVALDRDASTVRGLTYYDQKETPGLGGEIGNPNWQALWRGRRMYDDQWNARITVIKGSAGPAETDPLRVDGLSGATVTSNAITQLMRFWMADSGYGRFLRNYRDGKVRLDAAAPTPGGRG
jgi:Na+-transporting NADH:ubiquinone oxidoreductase subunit C